MTPHSCPTPPAPTPPGRLRTIKDFADLLGISVRKAWRMVASGELPAPVKVGRRGTRFRQEDVDAYLRSLPTKSGCNTI